MKTILTTPYPYQRTGAAKVERFGGRALLADDMGLGKTFQSLLWARRNPEANPVVVICPASVKWSWEDEAARHMGMRAQILEGRTPLKKLPMNPWPLTVLNYDILDAWLELLKQLRPQLVIVDECHMISNMGTKRYKAVRELLHGVPYVIGLSGTPLTNQPAELFPILNLLKPDLFPSFAKFVHEYTIPKLTPWGWTYTKPRKRTLPKLHKLLTKHVMIRRLKEDVLKDLPAKTRTIVPLPLSDRREYEKAERDFLGWLKAISPGLAKRAKRAEQVTKVSYLKRLTAQLKMKSVIQWIDDYLRESDGKLLVFGVHRNILGDLHTHYRKNSVLVNGSVKGIKRQAMIHRFRDRPDVRLFFGNMRSVGVGVNGLQAASDVAFIEMGWTPGEHDQAEGRAHRIGQKKHVSCYYLIVKDTIEEKLCRIIHDKRRTCTTILDGKQVMEQASSEDVMTLLLKDMSRRTK